MSKYQKNIPVNAHDRDDYTDIINLPHHVSKQYPQMSLRSRAAQFAPFAALTGYEAVIQEATRVTEERVELDDQEVENINHQLQMLMVERDCFQHRKSVCVSYFMPDSKKSGGKYVKVRGVFQGVEVGIEESEKVLVISDGLIDTQPLRIPLSDLVQIVVL